MTVTFFFLHSCPSLLFFPLLPPAFSLFLGFFSSVWVSWESSVILVSWCLELLSFFYAFFSSFLLILLYHSNSEFVYASLNVFITNFHNLIWAKRSQRNKGTANCHPCLLLQSTSSACFCLQKHRVIWTFKTIS